jgi:hypothetical protein
LPNWQKRGSSRPPASALIGHHIFESAQPLLEFGKRFSLSASQRH